MPNTGLMHVKHMSRPCLPHAQSMSNLGLNGCITHVYHMSHPFLPHESAVSTACLPNVYHMFLQCLPHVSPMSTACLMHAQRISNACLAHAERMSGTCFLHAGHMSNACLMQVRYRPYSGTNISRYAEVMHCISHAASCSMQLKVYDTFGLDMGFAETERDRRSILRREVHLVQCTSRKGTAWKQ